MRYLGRLIALLSLVAAVNTSSAQLKLDTLGWKPPLRIPLYLSGNFAELRSGHFHAGLDLKTQGKEGYRVYAVKDGYVSRIKVSPTGYGHSVYITHPDGYTSLYAHMREFNIQIGRYVRAAQYRNKSFPVDLFLKPDEIPVRAMCSDYRETQARRVVRTCISRFATHAMLARLTVCSWVLILRMI